MAPKSRAMELHAPTDGDLLVAHLNGDPQAFGRLYDRYDEASFRFIRRTLGAGGFHVAEDLHQDAWVSVARGADGFDPQRASFRTWLFTIARRKVWDHFRRERLTVVVYSHDDAIVRAPDPGPTPLQAVETRERAERVVAAVEALPLAQRETFVMFAHAGLSLQEIAAVTGAPLETAKTRLRYARSALRQALAAERSPHV